MNEKTYKESSVLVEFGTRKPVLVEDFRSLEEYWQDEAHDKDKEIDRLTAQLDASRVLLAERDAEIERLKLIEVVYRAIINNTHIAEDERLAKIIELTEQLTASQQDLEAERVVHRNTIDNYNALQQEVGINHHKQKGKDNGTDLH